MQKNLFDFASQNQNDALNGIDKESSNKHGSSFSNNDTINNRSNSNFDTSNNNDFKTNANSQNNLGNNSRPSLEEQAKTAYEKYQNYSQDELMDEFLKTSKQKLREGSLTPEKLQNTVNSLSPFLNNTQKEFLKGLIDKLND